MEEIFIRYGASKLLTFTRKGGLRSQLQDPAGPCGNIIHLALGHRQWWPGMGCRQRGLSSFVRSVSVQLVQI
jgi:hypothetical protein